MIKTISPSSNGAVPNLIKINISGPRLSGPRLSRQVSNKYLRLSPVNYQYPSVRLKMNESRRLFARSYIYWAILLFYTFVALTSASVNLRRNTGEVLLGQGPKTGTLDQYLETYCFIIKPEYRKNKKFRKGFIAALRKVAMPPQASNVFPIESQFLGMVAIDVNMPPRPSDSPIFTDIEKKYGGALEIFLKVFSDVEEKLRTNDGDWNKNPPSWLSIEDSKKSPRFAEVDTINRIDPDPMSLDKRKRGTEKNMDTEEYTKKAKAYGQRFGKELPEMRALSQPPGVELTQSMIFWQYRNSGKNQVVYVLDTQCDPTAQELSGVKWGDWISAGAFPWDQRGPLLPFAASASHGTCMVSKIAGKVTGLAGDAEIVFVEVLSGRGFARLYILSDVIDGILKIYDHIKRRKVKRNNVISLSMGIYLSMVRTIAKVNNKDANAAEKAYADILRYIFKELIQLPNVIVVNSAGNSAPGTIIDHYPAVLAKDAEYNNKLVVVGGYDPRTGENVYQEAEYVRIWAPAMGIAMPCGKGERKRSRSALFKKFDLCGPRAGATSVAAATVSGVLAALLSTGMPIDKVINYMYDQAHPRVLDGPLALFNGIGIKKWPPEQRPQWFNDKLPPPAPPLSLNGGSGSMDISTADPDDICCLT
ncbi:hypothetical protein TWF730_009020 [Orbilia blumenaviensis]|uniref:Peptidase S8/S53 domain-containing protein n=1 Tax=Orbilia blumenaviensis TaxID=1796055 RepID=A0AAV9V084_9PEZI